MTQNSRKIIIYAYFGFLALAILPNIGANYLQNVLPDTKQHGILLNLLIFAAICASLFIPFRWAFSKAARLLGSTARLTTTKTESPKRFLLMGISPILKEETLTLALDLAKKIPPDVLQAASKIFNGYVEKNEASLPAGARTTTIPWQQNVRAIYPHSSRLEAIYVLSPNSAQFEKFREFLKNVFRDVLPNLKIVSITQRGTDKPYPWEDKGFEPYEDYSYVYDGLSRGLEMITEANGGKSCHDDVCVDVAPGLKPFSIAAAILTLNCKLKFSYVTSGQTENGGRVLFYDAGVTIGE